MRYATCAAHSAMSSTGTVSISCSASLPCSPKPASTTASKSKSPPSSSRGDDVHHPNRRQVALRRRVDRDGTEAWCQADDLGALTRRGPGRRSDLGGHRRRGVGVEHQDPHAGSPTRAEDRLAGHPGLQHRTTQGDTVVRADRVAVPKRVGVNDGFGVRIERAEIRPRPTAIRPRSPNPARAAGRSDIHRLSSASPKPRFAACVHTARGPSCSELIPPKARPKSPVALHLWGARRVVRHDHVQRAVAQARPTAGRGWRCRGWAGTRRTRWRRRESSPRRTSGSAGRSRP